MRPLSLIVGAVGVLSALSHVAFAQQEETLTLTKVLYFDCTIARNGVPQETHDVDVSYLVYADQPAPQVNFYDPSKLFGQPTGWAPKGHFALSRQLSDRELYVWRGRQPEGLNPVVDSTFELTPVPDAPSRSMLTVTFFKEASAGAISVERFGGSCTTLSGKSAWDRYQNGVPK